MTVYLDSTLVIRRLLGIGKASDFWGSWDRAYASTLLRTECFRAANVLRLSGKLDDAGRARLGSWIETVCASVTQVPLTDSVLRRAADAFPVAIGTLQAVHLATMQELESVHGIKCAIASDDSALVQAAKSLGFEDAFEVFSQKPDEKSADAK